MLSPLFINNNIKDMEENKIKEHRNDLLARWWEASKILKQAKEVESALRDQCFQAFEDMLPDPHTTDAGVTTIDLPLNFKLKVTSGLIYSLDKDSYKVLDALSLIDERHPDVSSFTEQLVRWKPTLSVSFYKTLNELDRAHIDRVLTITDAKPTLAIVEPKEIFIKQATIKDSDTW